ncbi:MAG: type IV pilin protein [Thermoplasmata archaeon]
MLKNKNGITLIELLITIVIIAIIASISVPIYTNYLIRARRADAKAALEQVRAAQEMWRAEHGSYSTDVTQLQNSAGAPSTSISKYYNWEFTVINANSFTARAVPIGSQPASEELFINHRGEKWPADKWAK